jgi:hypothetical protein
MDQGKSPVAPWMAATSAPLQQARKTLRCIKEIARQSG